VTILGVDPGAHGTIAVLDESGDLLEVVDAPSTPEANGRTGTNAPLFAAILSRSHARVAFCEFVGARPTDAKVAAFAFGRARGVIEGCAVALGLPIVFLTGLETAGRDSARRREQGLGSHPRNCPMASPG
jgi:crossover junction endodeoxyribonuclease RuvC